MVSVLMCTYNRAYCLRQAIDSVLNQTYTNFEFIIVDDGSTDETEALIKLYTDSRIKYLQMEQNSFYCYAANYGLQHCKGEYIAFINSDDEWMPDKLEKQVEFLTKNKKYGACFSAVYLMDADGNDVTAENRQMRDLFAQKYNSQKECLQHFLSKGNTLCHPSALVRKSILDQIGGFNLMYCQVADLDLWIRIVTVAPIYVFDERLMRFRWDIRKNNQVSSATRENTVRTFNEQMMIRKDLVERLSDDQFIKFFGEKFKNKLSRSHLEIEFEKAFLLAECLGEVPELKILGIYKLEQVLRMPGAMDVLRNHFGMRIHDVYEWNKAHMYNELWLAEERNEKYEEQKRQLIEKHRMEIEEYENSKSWKITAPLRNIARRLKRVL